MVPPLDLPLVMLMVALMLVLAAARFTGFRGRNRRRGFQASDYHPKPFLTPWETRSLAEITADLPAHYHACPQVRLADLVGITVRDPSLRQAALNRVALKSVDFVIVDQSGRAVLVIELDDRTHDRADRRVRDRQVDALLARCQVPLVRVRPGRRIEIKRHLDAHRRAAPSHLLSTSR